jgi:hypothetical protein
LCVCVLGIFKIGSHICPRLALNHDPPDLCLVLSFVTLLPLCHEVSNLLCYLLPLSWYSAPKYGTNQLCTGSSETMSQNESFFL